MRLGKWALAGVGGLAAGVSLLAASLIPPAANASSSRPLVVAYDADAVSMDPAQVTDINTMQVLTQMYQGLVAWSPTVKDKIVGVLATSWSHNATDTQYTFQLRHGVKFCDGTPFNAQSVVFSFERQLDPSNPDYKYGPYPFGSFFFGNVKSVTAKGPYTVVFTLKSPDASLLSLLTVATAFVVSPTTAMRDKGTFALHGCGTGPYELAKWQRGVQLVLERNPYYTGPAPASSEIVFVPAVQSDTRVSELQSGSADIAIDPTPSSLASLVASGRFGVLKGVGPHVWWVGLNTLYKPLSNPLVREALNYAINKQAIIKGILYGTGIPATQPLSPGQLGYNASLAGYPYNPQKARQLLKQAGYPHGFTVNFFVPTSGSGMQEPVAMGEAIQEYLQAVGIKVKIVELDWGTFLGKINAGALKAGADMWELSWMDSAVDPSLVLGPLLVRSSWPPGFNSGFYSDPKVNSLVAQALGETNPQKRAQMYSEAEALITKDAPWIFVDHADAVYAYSKNVKGFRLNPTFPFLINLSTAYVQ
jgi:peptide/nickel transport system substrate-binding protein